MQKVKSLRVKNYKAFFKVLKKNKYNCRATGEAMGVTTVAAFLRVNALRQAGANIPKFNDATPKKLKAVRKRYRLGKNLLRTLRDNLDYITS